MTYNADLGITLLGDAAGDLKAYSFANKRVAFSIPYPFPSLPNGYASVLQAYFNEKSDEITAVYGSGAVCKYPVCYIRL